MEKYIKKIKNQTTVAVVVLVVMFLLAIAVQCLYKFTDLMPKLDLGKWNVYVSIVFPAVAALLYVVLIPYSKKKYRAMIQIPSIENKLHDYLSFMSKVKIIVIALSFVMAAVSIVAPIGLIMIVCLSAMVLMLVANAMSANPYSIKQRLQLTNSEMNELYGEGWEERVK